MGRVIVFAYIIFATFTFCEAREVELKALPEPKEVVGENEERLKEGKDMQQRILELRLLRELRNTLRMKIAHPEQPGINQEIIALTDRMVQSSSRAEIFFAAAKALFFCGEYEQADSVLKKLETDFGDQKAIMVVESAGVVALYWRSAIARHLGRNQEVVHMYDKIVSRTSGSENALTHKVLTSLHFAEIAITDTSKKTEAVQRLDEVIQEMASRNGQHIGEEFRILRENRARYRRERLLHGPSDARRWMIPLEPRFEEYMRWESSLPLFFSPALGSAGSYFRGSDPNYIDAIQEGCLKRVLESQSAADRNSARLVLAKQYKAKGEHSKAEEMLSGVVREESFYSPLAGVLRAKGLRESGRFADAIEALSEIEKEYPAYLPYIRSTKEEW